MHLIRKGKTEDGEIIAKIKIDNWRKTYKNIFPDTLLENLEIKSETQKCINNIKKRNVIVYERENEIIAYCYYGKRNDDTYEQYEGEVFALYVKNECQDHGIGKELLNYAIKDLFTKYKKVLLWCAKENTRAISFYERNGLEFIGRGIEEIGGKDIEKVALGISSKDDDELQKSYLKNINGDTVELKSTETHLYKLKNSANYIENEENIAIYANPDLIFLKDETKKWFKEIINHENISKIPQKFINYLLAKDIIETEALT